MKSEKVRNLKFNTLICKYDYATQYVPTKPSAEAKICLDCTKNKCKGTCERLRTERKKLKDQCDGK